MMRLLVSYSILMTMQTHSCQSIAHKEAYEAGYLHWDVSSGNIIIYIGDGYLINWDLAKPTKIETPRHVTCMVCHTVVSCLPSDESWQGTWQFMSAHLVSNRSTIHTFQDDLESSFWVLLWMALMYSDTSLSIEERSNFIRDTFESAGEQKWGVFAFQTIFKCNDPNLPALFPNNPPLFQLLKDLADLFGHFYYEPSEAEWTLLPSSLNDLLEREKKYLQALAVYGHKESLDRLGNHTHTIAYFANHLKSGTWPEQDAAVAQKLTSVNCWGEEGTSNVVLKSKHVLELVLEEEMKSRKKAKGPTVGSLEE